MERGLDPMATNLVVADPTRTEKTICLAVSPSLKAHGISGRARLFEVVQQVSEANALRQQHAPGRRFRGGSYDAKKLQQDPSLAIDYIVAPPQMALYMDYSTRIYQVYLRHIAPEDIHVYSIDEVFIDATCYLKAGGLSPREFAMMLVREVLAETGVTATAGIGTNLYLCKIAMDILAKKMPPDQNGVRIAELDEMSYRRELWSHRPLTDFWRIGRGYANKLERYGMSTMGDVARCSLYNEDLLYKLFGINAELLIDHAWGWEPCTIAQIKAYKPASNSLSTGQVLQCPYDFQKARLIVQEMTDLLVLDLVEKHLVTDQLVLTVGYDVECLTNPDIAWRYNGPVVTDHYGRKIPKHAHGTVNLKKRSSSTRLITDAVMELYDRIMNPSLLVRRITLAACRLMDEQQAIDAELPEQLELFVDYQALEQQRRREEAALAKEKQMQHAVIYLKKRFGKNAVIKGMNLKEGATARERNRQIGGHKK